ncbi:MAG TPA: hypothetical protein VMT95_00465 [Candidatus Binatia bacterium]|nr:hypothetical protein [Candidatus Binatia bacterium]
MRGTVVGVGLAAGERAGDPLACGVTPATRFDVGSGFGEADVFADGASVGVSDGAGVGVRSGMRVALGDGSGSEGNGVTVGIGATATLFGGAAPPLEPPKKCASTPPSKSPANTTTKMSGKSGSPPLGSSPNRRRRGGSLICSQSLP